MQHILLAFALFTPVTPIVLSYSDAIGSIIEYQNVADREPSETFIKSVATKVIGTPQTPIYVIDDFLTQSTCSQIIHELEKTLKPSTLTRDLANDPYFRTSSTGIFFKSKTQDYVNKKMIDFMSIEHHETPQIQHYSISQEFKPHWDAFDPKFDKSYYSKGQRSWTFMIYLNDLQEGGETYFPKLNATVTPKTGKAILWYNLNADGDLDRDTLHQGKPIVKGEKYVVTKWFN